MLSRHLHRLIQIRALKDVEPPDLLFGLRKRAIRDHDLATADADRRGVLRARELLTLHLHATPVHLPHPGLHLRPDRRSLLRRELDRRITANQHHVFHLESSLAPYVVTGTAARKAGGAG
ncbi:MAG TPA: hypothetical protein VEF89_25900 [Solirubrobacteraceae bacterium]|nr:hypothetical protein [Solirubrobacteraceae bacterium]